MGASLVVEGSTNRTVFEAYLEHVLCPTLERGQIVVMDNLSSYKGERVRELIEQKGCELLYLPPCSPDFNPIVQEAFSKLKSDLREACARSQQTLLEVIGEAITTSDVEGFFEHCGYQTVGSISIPGATTRRFSLSRAGAGPVPSSILCLRPDARRQRPLLRGKPPRPRRSTESCRGRRWKSG